MNNNRDHLEAVGGGPSHLYGVLQSVGAGGALFQRGDRGAINVHVDAVSGSTYRYFTTGDG